MQYEKKGRLIEDLTQIEQYKPILDKDNFQSSEPHWRRVSKNTITLFQVLIDQDLSDLVAILNHYPRYVEWVCEHFRYAYSYSENEASIDAASQLLYLGEPYFSKQFVRNVVRKLPKIDALDLEALQAFINSFEKEASQWHPIITNHYHDDINYQLECLKLHPLQRIALSKPLAAIPYQDTYKYEAEDRDAVLDIPYMN